MIELERVRIDHPRGGEPLLSDAELTIGRGQVVLLGCAASGGGSRLIAALVGEAPVGAGRLALFGRELGRLRRSSLLRLRRRIGVVPQDLELLGGLSALGNVILPLEIDGVPRRAAALRAAELLAQVGLGAELDTPIARLSMAERQRVAVARALVRAPQIVVCDQPTSHQDAAGAADVARLLAATAAAGASVLVVSRDPNLAAAARGLEWRHMILVEGRIRDARPLPMRDRVVDDAIIERLDIDAIDLSDPLEHVIEEIDIAESMPVSAPVTMPAAMTASAPVPTPLATITPISAAVAAAEPMPPAELGDHAAIPNVVPFPITARSRGLR